MVFAAVCGASRKLKEINQRWFAAVVLSGRIGEF
jgi:hypothetical protein